MGACLGKRSSKYIARKHSLPTRNTQNQVQASKPEPPPSSSSLPPQEKLQEVLDGIDQVVGEDCTTPMNDSSSVDSEAQAIIDEQTIINEVLRQPLPSRIISVTESELELELAKLIYGSPTGDYAENSLNTSTNKPNGDV